MAYNKTIYIEQQLTKYLKDYSEGKITQDDINWGELSLVVRRCQELRIMDELHRQMQPYYEMYLYADSRLFGGRSWHCHSFIENTARYDDEFASFAESHDLIDITESWSEYLRSTDTGIGLYQKLLRILLESGYDTNWQQLAETLKSDLHQAEVYSDYKTGELMAFLHGVTMLMNTSWDDKKKMDCFELLCDKWDFLKHFYSVMIRRVIGCKLANFSAVANLVAQQPKYHQYIHIFYCVLCYRQDSLNLSRKQLKTLESQMGRISNIMDETKPSDALNELLDTLFPEDFQRMLDEYRPETREQLEKERNRLKYEVGLLTEQMTDMAMKLKNALERSVPVDYIEEQLLRLSPGTALDLCSKLTMMLSDNNAWMTSMPKIKEKILEKKEEQDRQLADLLQKVAEKSPVEVNVGQGGTAQITESDIVNQYPTLLE
jgi:hypothetical protein